MCVSETDEERAAKAHVLVELALLRVRVQPKVGRLLEEGGQPLIDERYPHDLSRRRARAKERRRSLVRERSGLGDVRCQLQTLRRLAGRRHELPEHAAVGRGRLWGKRQARGRQTMAMSCCSIKELSQHLSFPSLSKWLSGHPLSCTPSATRPASQFMSLPLPLPNHHAYTLDASGKQQAAPRHAAHDASFRRAIPP